MYRSLVCASCVALAGVLSFATSSRAQPANAAPAAPLPNGQELVDLPVRIVDNTGKPVPNTKVTPWALGSSQGHGWWNKDDKLSGVSPADAVADNDGNLMVKYPLFRDLEEQVRTTSVSIMVDHPNYGYLNGIHVNAPLPKNAPHVVALTLGVSLEVRPLIDDKPVSLANVHVIWSDGRSWLPGIAPQKMVDGSLKIPAMQPGENNVLVAMLDGDRVSHFSQVVDFYLDAGETKKVDVPLRASARIRGVLSANVPRPVRAGRVKVWTLQPNMEARNRVNWMTWAPVQPDGTFTIAGWPADERLQLIAMCDGFYATSGAAPDVVKNANQGFFLRPQVLSPADAQPIEVAMSPMARCVVTLLDDRQQPIPGISVSSWPNVGWWNSGSQIYCWPLVRSERALLTRGYQQAADNDFPQPFSATTNEKGQATLELPPGAESLSIESALYELPVVNGRRDVNVGLIEGETLEQTLQLQPRGTDKLGQ